MEYSFAGFDKETEGVRDGTRRGIPAVALTAYARSEDRMRSLASGLQMHVPKPIDAGELVMIIASLAGRLDQNVTV